MSDEMLPTDGDELHDRLLDRALRERLGGEKAPDLSQRIVAAAQPTSSASAAIIERPLSPTPFRWGALAIAASLLIAVGIGVLSLTMHAGREEAKPVARSANNGIPGSGEREAQQLFYPTEEQVLLERTVAEQAQAFPEAEHLNADVKLAAPSESASSRPGPAANGEGRVGPQQSVAGYSLDGTRAAGVGQLRTRFDRGSTRSTNVVGKEKTQGLGDIVAEPALQESLPWGEQAAPVQLAIQPSGAEGAEGREQLVRRRSLRENGLRDTSEAPRASATVGLDPGNGAAPDYTVDLDLPFRQGSFGRSYYRRDSRATGDNYAPIVDNPFRAVRAVSASSADNRLSTFSIDVDTASYANVRQFLMQSGTLPPPDAVRIEELVNYFSYDYAAPTGADPFAAHVEVAACPWAPKHRLVRFGIKGREVERANRPKSNLVFLVDVSGSMDEPQKLPLLVEGMRMLTRELGENDRVAIVVYASTEGLALESTRGDQQQAILAALDRLSAGGSTAGGAGVQLAYKVAADNFIEGGTNRVILCTDGDFNVGVTDVEALKQLAADKAKDTDVFLTVLGFGRGNLNDELMEAVADNGNGAYHYVDNRSEARKVLVEQMTGTLVTIAKDVKIQVEFNPSQVAAYRLIGYENRVLAAEDFNNDAKDAGEIGAGHTVTALYEIVPVGEAVATSDVDELKYAKQGEPASAGGPDESPTKYGANDEASGELLTLKIRYKQPDGDVSTKLEFPVTDGGQQFAKASSDFQFASSVAGFGMLLRRSPYKGAATFGGMLEIAESAAGSQDSRGYQREFVEMISRAKQLAGE